MNFEVHLAIFQFLESTSPLLTDITHKSVTELTTTFFSIHTNDIRPYLVCLTDDESPKTMYKLPSKTINNNILQSEAYSEIKEII